MYDVHRIGRTVLLIAIIGCGSSKEDAAADADGGSSGKGATRQEDASDGNDADTLPGTDTGCGNGKVEDLEECDDGNTNDTDGCTSLCEFSCYEDTDCPTDSCSGKGVKCDQTTHACTPGSGAKPDGTVCGDDASCYQGKCVIHACNNGIKEEGEECDDGNASDTDGCTTQCKFPCVPGNENYPDCLDDCELTGTCDGGSGGAAGGGAGGQGGAGDVVIDFEECIASLQKCDFTSMETPCSSITTLEIPLTAGGSYGPVEVPQGPYGSYAEWNEGRDFANPENPAEPTCIPTGIESFAEPASVNAELEDLRGMEWSLYTIFRPACFKKGEKYPVITWANGTCGETGGYGTLLGTVASYGFVIFAANSTWTATIPTDTVQLRALDFAEAANEDPDSIFYQRLDLDRVGAMGHSQGSLATVNAASDPRIRALIFWNGGIFGASNDKPFLSVSGERDIDSSITPDTMASDTDAATQPAAWVYYHKILVTGGITTGHLMLMEQPDRAWQLAVSWWQYMLNDDAEAKKMFIGDSCGLCNHEDDYEYGHNSLLK